MGGKHGRLGDFCRLVSISSEYTAVFRTMPRSTNKKPLNRPMKSLNCQIGLLNSLHPERGLCEGCVDGFCTRLSLLVGVSTGRGEEGGSRFDTASAMVCRTRRSARQPETRPAPEPGGKQIAIGMATEAVNHPARGLASASITVRAVKGGVRAVRGSGQRL